MATRSVTTDESKSVEYQLSEQDRQSLLPTPMASIPIQNLAVIERQRRQFIKCFGWDGLTGSAPAEAAEFCSKRHLAKESL